MSEDAVETTLCSNCKRDILSTNFVIHTIHCQRNIYLCPKCDEPVNRGQQAEHDESYHTSTFCTSCHIQLEKYKLNDHLTNDCPKRKTKCQICEIEVEVSEISEHENYCGARTEKCEECGEFVMLKYKQLHLDSNHTFMKLSDEPGPSPSWQNGRRFLGNFLSDVNSGNLKTQSGQKKKSVQNRTRNSLSDHYEKQNHNDAVGSDSNEKNNFLPSNDEESHKTQKTMPKLPKETATGAVKKTISSNSNFSPSYVPNKVYDNIEGERMKNKDKAINKVLKKSLNTDKDAMLELDRLLALQVSENEEKLIREKQKSDLDETAAMLIAMQIEDDLKSQQELLAKKHVPVVEEDRDLLLALQLNDELNEKKRVPVVDENKDLLLALQLNDELNAKKRVPVVDENKDLLLALQLNDQLKSEEDTSNDHLIAQHLAEELSRKNDKPVNPNPFLEAIEKNHFEDPEASFKNIYKDQEEVKTVRKPELTMFSDDSDDDLNLLAYADNERKKRIESENIRLPCEFCEKMIPATYLNTHQQGCKDIYRKNDIFGKLNSSFEEEKAECDLCGKLYPISNLDSHEKLCAKTVRLLDQSFKRSARMERLGGQNYWKKLAKVPNANSNLNHNSPAQNGIESYSPESRGVPRRNDFLNTPRSNNTPLENSRRNMNPRESFGAVPRTQQPSRKNRRAPSPPKM